MDKRFIGGVIAGVIGGMVGFTGNELLHLRKEQSSPIRIITFRDGQTVISFKNTVLDVPGPRLIKNKDDPNVWVACWAGQHFERDKDYLAGAPSATCEPNAPPSSLLPDGSKRFGGS